MCAATKMTLPPTLEKSDTTIRSRPMGSLGLQPEFDSFLCAHIQSALLATELLSYLNPKLPLQFLWNLQIQYQAVTLKPMNQLEKSYMSSYHTYAHRDILYNESPTFRRLRH